MTLRGQRLLILLAALTACALTARLGVWQLDRAGQKLRLQQSIESRAAEPPLPMAELARSAEGAAAQHYRSIVLHGRWRPEATVWLDNRQMDGHPGFFVLTPLELAPRDAVIVQRGWVPRDPQDRTRRPPLPTPAGEVTLQGRVAPPPARLFEFEGGEHGAIRQNLDLADESRALGLPLRPLSVQQLAPSDGIDDGLRRHWPAPAVDVSKHHGYAFQWFALCALIAALYVWFQLIRPRLQQPAR